MQAGKELDGPMLANAISRWSQSAQNAIESHIFLEDLGLHKQVANRILEPFMWHTTIITATDWDNFFHQRCHPDAQPEMKALADCMQLAYYSSVPNPVDYGEWHTPYISVEDMPNICDLIRPVEGTISSALGSVIEIQKKVSVARCARVSYLTQDGKRDIEVDLELYERLTKGSHWSPFEHIAIPATIDNIISDEHPVAKRVLGEAMKEAISTTRFGNFRGWVQFRKFFANENRKNFIPNLPELEDVAKKMQEEETDRLYRKAHPVTKDNPLGFIDKGGIGGQH
jgi:hypothetical protein